MKEKSTGLKSNLKKVDDHKVSSEEYEEIPELPKEFFIEGQLYREGKPVARKTRGKQKKPVKISKTVRFDRDVIDYFQEDGPGWQTRLNDVLVDYVKRKRSRKKRNERKLI